MKKNWLLIAVGLVVVVLAVVAIACGDDDNGDGNGDGNGIETPSDGNGTGNTHEQTLSDVLARGRLNCGVNDGVPGFGFLEADGTSSGFDVDFCRALAAAIFGDSELVDYFILTAAARFEALAGGEIDVLALSRAVALHERPEHSEHAVGADGRVQPAHEPHRLLVRVPCHVLDAPGGAEDIGIGPVTGVGPATAETRHRDENHIAAPLPQDVVSEAHTLQRSWAERLDHNVAYLHQAS